MRFIIVGSTKGDIDYINEYAINSNADVVLSVGDLGIFYRNTRLPKSFLCNQFPEYLEGSKKFIKPVIAIRGVHDNLSLCKRLIDKDVEIHNFTLLRDGEIIAVDNNTVDNIPINKIFIGGIGGSYSPKHYFEEKLFDNDKRHFNKESVDILSQGKIHILLMYDLIGGCNSKKIMFSDETYQLFDKTFPFYCLVGKYNWWASSHLPTLNVVSLPHAKNGYLVIDTNQDWRAEGIRFDLSIGSNK